MSWVVRAKAYTWDELKYAVAQKGLKMSDIYQALGGEDVAPDDAAIWEWLDEVSDPQELEGYLLYEYGKIPEVGPHE